MESTRCTICNHTHRKIIEKEMLGDHSDRSIAEKYGFSHMSVSRHKKHIAKKIESAQAASKMLEVKDGFSSLDTIGRKIEDVKVYIERAAIALENVLEDGVKSGNSVQIVAAARAMIEAGKQLQAQIDKLQSKSAVDPHVITIIEPGQCARIAECPEFCLFLPPPE